MQARLAASANLDRGFFLICQQLHKSWELPRTFYQVAVSGNEDIRILKPKEGIDAILPDIENSVLITICRRY